MSQSRRKIAVFSLILILTLVLASTSVMAFQWCQIFGTCQKTPAQTPTTAAPAASGNSVQSSCQTNLDFYKQQTDSLNSQLKKVNSDSSYYKNNAAFWKGQADMVTAAWEKDRQSATSKYNLQTLCGDYIYPRCSESAVSLTISCNSGGSMQPTMSCKDDIKAFIPSANYNYKVCDIITYDSKIPINGFDRITHRIVAMTGSNFITKGDSVGKTDPYHPKREDIRYVLCR